MNRREILRTGSLGTLGLLASQTFQTACAQARVAGANDRIRIGIIGFSDRLNSTPSMPSRQFLPAAMCIVRSPLQKPCRTNAPRSRR